MPRTIAVSLTAALILGAVALPADAGKKRKKKRIKRVMELSYTEPAYGTAGIGLCFQGSSCLFYGPPAPKEKFFSVEIEDSLGQAVNASVIQDTNEDGNYLATDDLTVHICGATEEPIEIEPKKEVAVWVWQGPGVNPPCPGGASSGTATATFSNRL
jgi:hypothetical protein